MKFYWKLYPRRLVRAGDIAENLPTTPKKKNFKALRQKQPREEGGVTGIDNIPDYVRTDEGPEMTESTLRNYPEVDGTRSANICFCHPIATHY